MGAIPDVVNGRVMFAHTSEVHPWWGLGNILPEKASIDEMCEQAGITWRAAMRKTYYIAYYVDEAGNKYGPGVDGTTPVWREVPGKYCVLRNDTFDVLGNDLTEKYKIHQPKEVFEGVFKELEARGAKPRVAGQMYGGAWVWVQAVIPSDLFVKDKRDKVERTVYAMTSFDGSTKTTIKDGLTIAVCRNTIDVLLGESGDVYKRGHKQRFDAALAQDAMGLETKATATLERMRRLSDVPIRDEVAEAAIVTWLYADKRDDLADIISSNTKAAREEYKKLASKKQVRDIMALFMRDQPNLAYDGVDRTAYGLLMAMTGAHDHGFGMQKGRDDYASNRFDRVWSKEGMAEKSVAFDICEAVSSDGTVTERIQIAVDMAQNIGPDADFVGLLNRPANIGIDSAF